MFFWTPCVIGGIIMDYSTPRRIMAMRTVYAYTEGTLEPLDREYFKNTLRFLPGVASVGAISKPAVPPPPRATLGFEVHYDPAKLNLADLHKRLLERGFQTVTIQELPGETQALPAAKVTAPVTAELFTPVAPNGVKEVLFRVDGLVTIQEVRRMRENLRGTPGIYEFYSMVPEAADEPWAGDVGLVDVQFDPVRITEESLRDLIERVEGCHVVGWKALAGNLNFPWPLSN